MQSTNISLKLQNGNQINVKVTSCDEHTDNNTSVRIRNTFIVEYEKSKVQNTYAVILQNPSKSDYNTIDSTTKNAIEILQDKCNKIVFLNVLPIYASDESKLIEILSNSDNTTLINKCNENLSKIKATLVDNKIEDILLAYGNCNIKGHTELFTQYINEIILIISENNKYKLSCVQLNTSNQRRPLHLGNKAHAVEIYRNNYNKLEALKVENNKLIRCK